MEEKAMRCGSLLLQIADAEFPKERNLREFIWENLEEVGTVLAEDIEWYQKMPEEDVARDYIWYMLKHLEF